MPRRNNLGAIPGAGATQRFSRIISKAKAMELILTGAPINAGDENVWGLVNRVVAFKEMDSEVTKLVNRIVAKSPLITSWAKQCVNHILDHNLCEGIEKELTQFCRTSDSQDCKEGTAAFLEKRKPVFVGR